MKRYIILFLLSILFSQEAKVNTIDVFHKDQPPSIKTLKKTKQVLESFKETYTINYHLITDPKNAEIIEQYDLPKTHFPFAIVINGKCTAEIDSSKIDFVHFPLFMKGIGRHEGNWSMKSLEMVLENNSLLIDENVLSELKGEESTSCDQ